MKCAVRLRSLSVSAGAAGVTGVAALIAGTIGTGAATAAISAPCAITAAPHTAGAQPLLGSVNTATPAGRVELHGTIGSKGGELVVVGCVASGNAIGNVTYDVMRAPKSARFVAFQTGTTTINADGSGATAEASVALATTEKQFDKLIKDLGHQISLPGLKGTVYVSSATTPLEILATKAGKKKVTTKAKTAAGAAFFKSYLSPYKPQG